MCVCECECVYTCGRVRTLLWCGAAVTILCRHIVFKLTEMRSGGCLDRQKQHYALTPSPEGRQSHITRGFCSNLFACFSMLPPERLALTRQWREERRNAGHFRELSQSPGKCLAQQGLQTPHLRVCWTRIRTGRNEMWVTALMNRRA